MQKYTISYLFIFVIAATYWAFCIGDYIINKHARTVSFIDLGSIFLLGIFTGALLAMSFLIKKYRFVEK